MLRRRVSWLGAATCRTSLAVPAASRRRQAGFFTRVPKKNHDQVISGTTVAMELQPHKTDIPLHSNASATGRVSGISNSSARRSGASALARRSGMSNRSSHTNATGQTGLSDVSGATARTAGTAVTARTGHTAVTAGSHVTAGTGATAGTGKTEATAGGAGLVWFRITISLNFSLFPEVEGTFHPILQEAKGFGCSQMEQVHQKNLSHRCL